MQDLAFGPDNRLYTLEGRRLDNQSKQWVGNCRVQVFDQQGKFLDQFAVAADGLVAEKSPARLAVSDDGRVFVSEPASGVVLEYQRGDTWRMPTLLCCRRCIRHRAVDCAGPAAHRGPRQTLRT